MSALCRPAARSRGAFSACPRWAAGSPDGLPRFSCSLPLPRCAPRPPLPPILTWRRRAPCLSGIVTHAQAGHHLLRGGLRGILRRGRDSRPGARSGRRGRQRPACGPLVRLQPLVCWSESGAEGTPHLHAGRAAHRACDSGGAAWRLGRARPAPRPARQGGGGGGGAGVTWASAAAAACAGSATAGARAAGKHGLCGASCMDQRQKQVHFLFRVSPAPMSDTQRAACGRAVRALRLVGCR